MSTHVSRFLRLAALTAAAAPVVTPANADSSPIGVLPQGPVALITTPRGLLIAFALPRPGVGVHCQAAS
jgi:hypothetical protein